MNAFWVGTIIPNNHPFDVQEPHLGLSCADLNGILFSVGPVNQLEGCIMNLTELKDKWIVIKDTLKQRYTGLTEDDLAELFRRLQSKIINPHRNLLAPIDDPKAQILNHPKP
jgi:hypothetical protein